MDSNTWLLILLAVVMIVCCGPMLFRGRHRKRAKDKQEHDHAKGE